MPYEIKTDKDVVQVSRMIQDKFMCPILRISNHDGWGLELLRDFLYSLPTSEKKWGSHSKERSEYHVHSLNIAKDFLLNGQIILSGLLFKGSIELGQQMQLGPDKNGKFVPVKITDILCMKVDV